MADIREKDDCGSALYAARFYEIATKVSNDSLHRHSDETICCSIKKFLNEKNTLQTSGEIN